MNRLRIWSNSGKRFLAAAALAAVLVLLAGGANALAATNTVWCVPNTSISPACTSGAGKTHIQDAVNAASEGDVILVGPGYYHETVEVEEENLTILGAQAGNDARVGRYDPSKESIVDASPGASGNGNGAAFYLDDEYEVIDGFTLQGGTSGNAASGIYIDDEYEQILNNIFQNNAVGIYDDGEDYNLIEYNLFKTNNKPQAGSWDNYIAGLSGFGIAGETEEGTSITENAFEGNLAAAMFLYYGEYTEINNNTSKDDGSFLACYDCEYTFFDHNQGQDFGAKGFLPLPYTSPSSPADAAIDLLYYNYVMQINDNVLECGKAANYNGIAFSTIAGVDYVCEYCQVSNNTITGFAGSGIAAEPYESEATLYYSFISRNDVENNGKDGILIGYSEYNEYNSLFDNKAKGNAVFDCADDTSNSLTLQTYNTWINNSGPLSYPTGLCTPVWPHAWHLGVTPANRD
jgi:hypothetical protein